MDAGLLARRMGGLKDPFYRLQHLGFFPVDTDRQMEPVLDALGDDAGTLIEQLSGWARTIREGKGYPASGPHELAEAAARP